MKHIKTRRCGKKEGGSIAVETALSLPLLLLFLVVPLYLARAFWYYSVAEKAAHDAARFLSNATQLEIVTGPSGFGTRLPVETLAASIADAEMEEIKPALEWGAIDVFCDSMTCGGTVPETVRVSVQLRMRDAIFGPFTAEFFGDGPLFMQAHVTMRYVGN